MRSNKQKKTTNKKVGNLSVPSTTQKGKATTTQTYEYGSESPMTQNRQRANGQHKTTKSQNNKTR